MCSMLHVMHGFYQDRSVVLVSHLLVAVICGVCTEW